MLLRACEFESRSWHQVCGRGGIWQTHHSQKVAVNSHIGSSPIVRTSFGQVKGIGIPSWPRTNCLGVRSPSCPPILRSWRNGSRAGLRKTRRCPAFPSDVPSWSTFLEYDISNVIRTCGVIGKRAALRTLWSQGRIGSSPIRCTKFGRTEHWLSSLAWKASGIVNNGPYGIVTHSFRQFWRRGRTVNPLVC